MRGRLLFVAWVSIALMGCTGGEWHEGSEWVSVDGILGNGGFVYHCVADNDHECAAPTAIDFPGRIALGSRFDVSFQPVGEHDGGGYVSIESICPSCLARTSGGFVALRAGQAGIIARQDRDGALLDYFHLHIEPAVQLEVVNAHGVPVGSRLTLGEQLELKVLPLDAFHVALAGGLVASWESSDHAVIDLLHSSPQGTMLVDVAALGQATLKVTVGGLERKIQFEVVPPDFDGSEESVDEAIGDADGADEAIQGEDAADGEEVGDAN